MSIRKPLTTVELPAAIRCGQEVSHEYKARGRHGGVPGEELVEALHDVGTVQPHVREEHEHRLGVVALKLNQLLVLTNLQKSFQSSEMLSYRLLA